MALPPGTRLGPYEILGPLGAGGMGEVYRARDQRLGRDVAVKALPDAFAKDPDRISRFEREAKLLASLSHPNIGAIHGLEDVGGHRYLVLECIEGESLAQRLARGPLPVDEAIEICIQIAAGLEAAHENGIVHRDLKPGNVMLTETGGVKLLDFGLAKGDDPAGSLDSSLSASPTMTYAATGAGVILGTAVYMSPEQARGKRVDRRTDIWSFGCVLYECLTGKQAFEGETVSDLIAKILEREPDWSALPPQTPPRVKRLLERCLRKNSRERLRDIGDARLELLEAESATPTLQIKTRRSVLPWLLAGSLGIALATAILVLFPHTHVPPGTLTRLSIDTPSGGGVTGYPGTFDMSPDGRWIAFLEEGSTQLWLRSMEDVTCRPLEGTEGATNPFWSPDSRNIGFFAEGKLKRIAVAGGAVQTICNATNGRGATWGSSGVIVFAPEPASPLFQVNASGGVPAAATVLDTSRGEWSHRFPQFLPDGRHFIYGVTPESQGDLFMNCVASLDDPHGKPTVLSTDVARYLAPGYLVFPRGQALLVQRLDLHSFKALGEPVQLDDLPNVSAPISLAPSTSASSDGRFLLYGSNERRTTDLVWFDRNGRRSNAVGHHPALLIAPDVSPAGDRVAVSEVIGVIGKGWIFDLEHGTSSVMPSPEGSLVNPKWSFDNRTVTWLQQVPGINRLVSINADGGGQKTLLESRTKYFEPGAWSPDGQSLLISQNVPGHQRDLLTLNVASGETRTWVGTSAMEDALDFSHDGRWIAYASDISGRPEICVDAFPEARGGKRVSSSGVGATFGGTFVAWRKDDRELYFLSPDGKSVLSCDANLNPEPSFGVPRVLFELPREIWGIAAAPEGDRFLILLPVGQRPAAFTVVQNWTRELDKGK
jgi:serine/threonine protein kinase/Tol biopolymer transport system component